MRAPYSEYVGHCMRFYARNTEHVLLRTPVDQANWLSCHKALKSFPLHEQKILLELYRRRDEMANTVHLVANTTGMTREAVWKLAAAFEKRAAQERGLL